MILKDLPVISSLPVWIILNLTYKNDCKFSTRGKYFSKFGPIGKCFRVPTFSIGKFVTKGKYIISPEQTVGEFRF